jgi:hypothetical protein
MPRNNDLFSFLRSQDLRKRVQRALQDLESGDIRGNADKLARRLVRDLRAAANEIEKRLDITGAGSRSRAAKKAASTRKRAATKRSTSAKKAAKTRARKSTGTKKKSTGTKKQSTGTRRSAKKRS